MRVGPERRLSAKELILFELWHWRRLLRVPWTARRSNHSILKEINPEYSLEGMMLKHVVPYSGDITKTILLIHVNIFNIKHMVLRQYT